MNNPHSTSRETISADEALNISQIISGIYHHTQGESTTNFGRKSLIQLAKLIDFDSAHWFIFSKYQPITIATEYTYGLNTDKTDKLDSKQLTELLQQTKITADSCIVLPQDKLYIHPLFNHQHNISHQMLAKHSEGNIQHLLILNKQRKTNKFSHTQSLELRFIVPLLAKAFEHNIKSQLTRHWNYWRSDKAICDQQGYIIFSQKGFINALTQNIDKWDQQKLPTKFTLSQLPLKQQYNNIKVDVFTDDNLIVAEAYQFDHQIESLTPTEIKIAELLLQAQTNKQMAQTLEIKEKTIEHHVKNLCTKLNVTNRTEALMILQNSDYRFK